MCNCGEEYRKKVAGIKDVQAYNKKIMERNKARGIPNTGRFIKGLQK